MSVVEFKRPARKEPHAVGEAICANCKHEWSATAPVGTTQIECPSCSTLRGAWKHPFGTCEGDDAYICNCGGEDFYISRREGQTIGAVRCRGCGKEATGWFE